MRLEKAGRGALIVSVGAWLASIPLTAWHFGTWNLYAPLTNLCLSVLVFPLMGVSLSGLMFAWCPWMLHVCNTAASWPASAMLAVAGGVASLPYSYLSSAPPSGENEAVIVPLQKDAWSAVISNPALVVGSGTEDAVRYTLLPVLKARSIRPCGMLCCGSGKAERAGEKELEKEYPGIRNWSPGNVLSGNGGYGRAMNLCWKIFLYRCARESVRTGAGCCHGNAAGGGS